MATPKKKGSITVANVVSILGLAGLFIFAFFGRSYMSGGELTSDIIISAVITLVAALLLWFMVKAKGAENNLKNWKIAEFSTLAVYIIAVIPCTLLLGVMHFFVVNEQKDTLKEYAEEDLQKIEVLIENYKNFENNALITTAQGLSNAVGIGQVCDEKLNRFFDENGISHSQIGVDSYIETQTTELVSVGLETIGNSILEGCNKVRAVVESWNWMQIPFQAKRIEELAAEASSSLTDMSQSAKLPRLALLENGMHTITQDNQTSTFEIEGGVESFKFRKNIMEAQGFSVMALVVVLLLHIAILFSYIFAYRTSVVTVGKGYEEDGGSVL